MALIKCPECGREKVSDSAEMCPDCGYGIKAYFEKIKSEEERQKIVEERKKEEQRVMEEKRKEEQAILDAMPVPAKPFPWQPLIGIFLVALAILFFSVSDFFAGFVASFFALIFGLGGYWEYQDKKRIYELSLNNMEQAKREALLHERLDKKIAEVQNEKVMNAINPFREVKNGVRCPMCGKTAGRKISTFNRAVSISVVGLASGKIGKQYKCSSCGHMW